MANLVDADAGTERFSGYEAELKLVQADLSQQIEQIKETTGEPRKAAISRAERALDEAEELVSAAWRMAWHCITRCADWADAPGKGQLPRAPQVDVQRPLPQLRA